jgi:hypothetical protein
MAKQIFAFFMVIFFCSTLAFAATQTNQKDQKKAPKRSGSCSIIEVENGQSQHLAAVQTKTRTSKQDRKKDGSCKTSLTEDEGLIISADQSRGKKSQKDHKRDRSCG